MYSPSGIKAILLMAGEGQRFGASTPKQFHPLAGKAVYLHTLETLLHSRLFDEILLVVSHLHLDAVREELSPYTDIPLTLVVGGKTRQESSYRALLQCSPDTRLVLIHDAVRPLVSQEILYNNVHTALHSHAVDTCIPSADTLVHSPSRSSIQAIPERAHYLRGQTPQTFSYPLILKAHELAPHLHHTDDCSLVLGFGHPVHIVQGDENNIKITTELDLFLAEQLLRLQTTRCNPSLTLHGQRIAVTGGTGGIGRALCTLLEQEGAIPFPISRSSLHYSADLTSYEETKKIFATLGPLDGLINSIGHLKVDPLDSLSEEEINTQIACNLTSVIYCCKWASLKKGGHIINIASSSYIRGKKHYTVYSSAKAALVNFTQGFAEEHPELCINALVPQRTHTPLRSLNFPGESPSTLLDPLEVARQAIHLLKTPSLTGSTIEVRRGRQARDEEDPCEAACKGGDDRWHRIPE